MNKDIEKRKEGKILKVYGFPQNNEYVPAIRVVGKWLNYFGFEFDDKVILIAEENKITIQKIINERKEGGKDG